jgi:hypothetical protein
MKVRYLFNTAGEYVAFVTGQNVFAPDSSWLGALLGEQVHNVAGEYVGQLRQDDRVVRLCGTTSDRRILTPREPMRPQRPIPPMRRLFMPPVQHPYEDVFLRGGSGLRFLLSWDRIQQLGIFEGSELVAADGAALGRITRDPTTVGSLANLVNPQRRADGEQSIFNPETPYGGRRSPISAFADSAASPPRIEREGEAIGFVSVNRTLPGAVHPYEILAWIDR